MKKIKQSLIRYITPVSIAILGNLSSHPYAFASSVSRDGFKDGGESSYTPVVVQPQPVFLNADQEIKVLEELLSQKNDQRIVLDFTHNVRDDENFYFLDSVANVLAQSDNVPNVVIQTPTLYDDRFYSQFILNLLQIPTVQRLSLLNVGAVDVESFVKTLSSQTHFKSLVVGGNIDIDDQGILNGVSAFIQSNAGLETLAMNFMRNASGLNYDPLLTAIKQHPHLRICNLVFYSTLTKQVEKTPNLNAMVYGIMQERQEQRSKSLSLAAVARSIAALSPRKGRDPNAASSQKIVDPNYFRRTVLVSPPASSPFEVLVANQPTDLSGSFASSGGEDDKNLGPGEESLPSPVVSPLSEKGIAAAKDDGAANQQHVDTPREVPVPLPTSVRVTIPPIAESAQPSTQKDSQKDNTKPKKERMLGDDSESESDNDQPA